MRPRALALLGLSLLASGALLASTATAARLRGVPASVRAGEQVVLEWDGLPESVHEVEFELRLEGGRWFRIGPEMEASEGRYAWRVPDVDCERAQIRMRMGGERSETALPPSEPFRIVGLVHEGPPRPHGIAAWGGDDLAPGLTRLGLHRRETCEWTECLAREALAPPDGGPGASGPTAQGQRGSRIPPRIAAAPERTGPIAIPRSRPLRN